MTVVGPPVPARTVGALRACSAAAGRAPGRRRAGCAGARGEAGATAGRLGCRHQSGLSGRWSGVRTAGTPGGRGRLTPPPCGCAATWAPRPPSCPPGPGRRLGSSPGSRPSLGATSGLLSCDRGATVSLSNGDDKTHFADVGKIRGDNVGVGCNLLPPPGECLIEVT